MNSKLEGITNAYTSDSQISHLTELPSELATEIMLHLDWIDVLRLRQTCMYLHELSRARPIWESLFHRAQSSFAFPTQPDRPIEKYPTEELERRSLQLLTSDNGWTDPNAGRTPAVERKIPRSNADSCYLLEGGRWFLSATRTASLIYYDLDEANPVARVLVPDQLRHCRTVLSVERDKEEPVLTFTILLYIKSDDPNRIINLFQFWKVSLDIEQSNTGTRLIARRTAMFKREKQGFLSGIYLCGNQFAYNVVSYAGSTWLPYIVVINDWHAVKDVYDHPKRVILLSKAYHGKSFNFRLLSGGLVAIITHSGCVQIYDIRGIEETTSCPPLTTEIHTRRAWRDYVDFPVILGTISHPFYHSTSNSIRLVITCQECIYGLIIPRNSRPDGDSNPPRLVKLMDCDTSFEHFGSRPGYHHTVIRPAKSRLVLLKYSWPDESDWPSSMTSMKNFSWRASNQIIRPNVDENSGRVVLLTKHEQFSVVDLAKYTLHSRQ